jgi:signal peptidase I
MFDMTPYETYVFFLCLIVFVLLAGFSSFCIYMLVRMLIRLVRSGQEDRRVVREYYSIEPQRGSVVDKILYFILTALMVGAFTVTFLFSQYVDVSENKYIESLPTFRVVQSSSMSEIHEKNSTISDLGLTDQFDTFDLIITHDMPAVEDIQLYDIVVYEVDDTLIIHRIIDIEAPNDKHPDEYYFATRGDAVPNADRYPVLYSQMKGIYRGERIPFVGSFILFMQSPAGWLCMIFVLAVTIITPIVEYKLKKEKARRAYRIRGWRHD